MFINPKIAIEKGWITGVKDPKRQVQPNAIDFTVDIVQALSVMPARVTESDKKMRSLMAFEPIDGMWTLNGNAVYDGTSDVYVNIPEGVAAVLWTRSSFARNGVFILSGLYDSGYIGHVGFTIYTPGGPIDIAPGTRIGQIAFMHSESAELYKGGWNHQQGTHYAGQAKTAKHDATQAVKPVEQPKVDSQVDPTIAGAASIGLGQELQETNKWNSDQGGKPAGTKNFV